MYKLFVSELAHQDLNNIVSYIVLQLLNPSAAGDFLDEVDKCYEYLKSNPSAAGDFLDEVDKCYEYLKSNPFIYEKCKDKRLEKEDYRRVVIKNYVLVYKIDEDTKTVTVFRFFYGAQDYIKLI